MTKFCRANSQTYKKYVDYIDRDEAIRNEHDEEFNLYADYMGNPEKTGGLFTQQKENLSSDEKKVLKKGMQKAQENGSLMWQTVISFDNRWLEENGLYDSESKLLDEKKLREITRNAIGKMLRNEHLEQAMWSAAIHYNTDNIHVHIATVEPEPMRQMKSYIQYHIVDRDGVKVKEPMLNPAGEPIRKEEYVGRFQAKSIELCKSSVVNQILREREANIKINQIIRGDILKRKKEHALLDDRDFREGFLKLYAKMPDCDRKMWNYNNQIMSNVREDIDHLVTMYLNKYHKEDFEKLQNELKKQELEYRKAYGESARGNHYRETKLKDLYTRMGNQVLQELRCYDKSMQYADVVDSQCGTGAKDSRKHSRIGWLLSSALWNLKRSFKKEWEKELNEREHEKLSVGPEEWER